MDDEHNNGFGPLSEKRGKRAQVFASLSLVVCTVVAGLYSHNHVAYVGQLLVCTVAAIFGEAIKNLCLSTEELFHLRERYNGNIKRAFDACFSHPYWGRFLISALICSCIILYIWDADKSSLDTQYLNYALLQLCLVPLVSFLLGLKRATQAEISELNEAGTTNVANGLAQIFYSGYLKLILPGIMEVINLLENDIDGQAARDIIEDHKLFIVIPKDCNCASTFAEVDPNIKFVSEAQARVMSRAGTQRRVYKTSIYKVVSDHGTFYCLMEFATPLLSILDMQTDPRFTFTREDKDQQVALFYKRLKEILDRDERCKGKYHLVLTSDAREDLADVIGKEVLKSRLSI